MLVETFSFDPTRLEEGGTYVEKLGGGRYRFRAKAQHCGVKNRNNRVYPIPVWEQHTSPTAAFSKRVKSRRVIGHLEHPSDGKSAMGMAAVLVVEVEAPNKKGEVWAIFETLSTPAGMIVASFIHDGVGFGISSRGNGSVVNKGGIDEVQEDYEPITFDMVIDESTPGAEVHARRLKESLCALMESAGGDPVRALQLDHRLGEEAAARDLNEGLVGESFTVRGSMPYSGIAVKLAFTSAAEAKTAHAMIAKAGFHTDHDGEYVTVYTNIEDEAAAVAHLTRLLSAKGIETQAESHQGHAVREAPMTLRRLTEMPYGGMEEMPYGEMSYEADDDEHPYDRDDDDDDLLGPMPDYDPAEEAEDDDEDDEDDEDDDEEMDEMGLNDPEDIDLDLDTEESVYEEYDDDGYVYEVHEDEDGHVKVWFDEDDDPIEIHHYNEDGILEAVTDGDGDILLEMPSAGMRAMFAKAFASTPRSKKTGKPKDPEKTAAAVRAKPGGAEYYRKFRKKWAGKKKGGGGKVHAGHAAKTGVRVKKGKGVTTRAAKAAKRRVKRTGMKHKPAEKVRKHPKVRKALKARGLAASVERYYDPETNMVETYMGDTLAAVHDHDTGLALFELRGGAGSPAAAMFAKVFSKKPPATTIRKKQKNYSKLRAGYAKTKHGKGMSPSKLRKGSRALPKGEKSARRKTRAKHAPVRSAMRKLRKGAAGKSPKAGRIAKKGTTKRGRAKGHKVTGSKKKAALAALKASHEFDLPNLLIEDETGLFYQHDGELVGGIDEDGDLFIFDEDGDQVWLGEDEGEYEDYDDDEYDDDYMDEMEVGAHGGGKPVALKMKGRGQEGRGVSKPKASAHGGGAGGKTGVRQGSGGEDESYDPYVERLESQIARQQEVIDAYQDLQHAEAMDEAKTSILDAHPELSVVETRLDRCQTAEDMRVEAEALLTLVESSRGSRPWSGKIEGNSGVSSDSVGGAPDVSLLAEDKIITGFDSAFNGAASSDTASRVAAARRRRLDEARN
jgi:hypothetical protein